MMSESGGDPNAVSPKGARGLMQVMPSTARDPGFGIRPSNGTPADDIRVGREYRAKMQQRYSGDPAKMWAAYNWGPGNLDKALAIHGEDWLRHAPAETRDYIASNLRALRASANPDHRSWDRRADGSPKGDGWLGPLRRPDGKVSSELSIGINIGGKEVEVPSMVPTLNQSEVAWLLTHPPTAKMPPSIVSKAADFARQRLAQGKSPFRELGEPISGNP